MTGAYACSITAPHALVTPVGIKRYTPRPGAFFGVSAGGAGSRGGARYDEAMTSDQLAQRDLLLADIRDAPDDDLPRLVLGDWLADLGDPRGEFIQIDVRLAQLEDGPRKQELEKRRRALLRDHAMAWLGPLLDLVSSWRWERGMLHVEARAERLLNSEGLATVRGEAFDWVEGLRLIAHHSLLGLSGFAEVVQRVSVLDLGGNDLPNMGARHILRASPRLGGLRWLGLADNQLGASGADCLVACRGLAGLTRLDLSGNPLGDDGVRALIESRHLNKLRYLGLHRVDLLPSTATSLQGRFGEAVVCVSS